jgi:transcription-repair coupling factor (superfamily II helicase)
MKMPSPEQRTDQRDRAQPRAPLPVAPLAAMLVDQARQGDLLFAASDEQRAAAVAAIAAALAPDLNVVHLPSSDALPGDDAPASPGNIGRRVAALRLLRRGPDAATVLLVTTAEATAVAYADPRAFDTAPPAIAVGDAIDLAAFAETAAAIGYIEDDRVDEPGEVAILGSVIDIFPADHDGPVRVVVTDGAVTAINAYDPVSQLTVEAIDRIEIGRASEPDATDGVSILAHLRGASLVYDVGAEDRRARFLTIAAEAGRLRRGREAVRVIDEADWRAARSTHRAVTLAATTTPSPRFAEKRDPARAFARFAKSLLEDGRLLVIGSPRDLRFLAARLQRVAGIVLEPVTRFAEALAATPGSAMMLAAPIDRGFVVDGLTVVAGGDLLGGRAGGDERSGASSDALFGDLSELRIGDVVVHEDFGIGVVAGLEGLDAGDAIALDYAKGGRRLVPVTEADRIWRYGADADAVTLDALDGSSWQKRRGAIDAAIAESARELAAIAAERDARTTDPIAPDASVYERFASGFAFTETPDQARAIAAVRDDLASGTPMDRLVVGDVGYGKTEVALRAAALVALAGRQVVIAAPTTVLVRQHLEVFTRRFEATGVAVAGLSRLSTPAEKKRVIAGLADGSIGVVVGTGAVAGKGVSYADLALVVVDEEQRFGAADKAKLHGLGAGHVLTLSATPIPRTLQSAMVGLQTISVIATPPARRQPIRTAVTGFDDATIRTALLRERGRGGQSFVVVPRIEDMTPLADTLARLVPELRVVAAHGKMPAGELDEAMVAFANGRGDVLLATNIIEAGLDVPRANTMIVHHADRFGLSQLHQLRGRVGRSGRRGQVMLTTEAGATIAEATLKRLRTLQAFDRLGAGFAISARDLDLRGAGDLVGEAQAGHMKLIGTDLYQHLMAHALRAARGQAVDLWTPELHLELSGCLPEAWIPDIGVRLSLYARLARLNDGAALDAFEAEIEDRFGAVPAEARDLLDIARIRALARSIGVRRIDAGQAAIALTPRGADLPVPAGLAEKNGRWLLSEAIADPAERVQRVRAMLEEIE